MSAIPAAALTCGSDIRPPQRGARPRPVPGLRRAPRPAGAPALTRGSTPGDTPALTPGDTPALTPVLTPRDTPALRSGDTPGSAPGATHSAPLRLTRRGRVVVAAVAALLVTVISLLAAGVAQATNHGPSPRAARQDLIQVVVRPGQSLWSVAESADPDQDTRTVIQQIIDLNSLSGDTVAAGQQLWIPRG